MNVRDRYYGSFDPSKPAGNRAEQWNGETNTYTAWDPAGNVTSTRQLTAPELAALTPTLADKVPDARTVAIATARTIAANVKADLDGAAPTTLAQVVQQLRRVQRLSLFATRLHTLQLDTTPADLTE